LLGRSPEIPFSVGGPVMAVTATKKKCMLVLAPMYRPTVRLQA